MKPIHPSRLIKSELDELEMSITTFAHIMGLDEEWTERFFKEKEPMTQDVAMRIYSAWGITPKALMTLQELYDEDVKKERTERKKMLIVFAIALVCFIVSWILKKG